MSSLRFSVANRFAVISLHLVAAGAALGVGGCASDEEYRRQVYGAPQQQMAMRGPMQPRPVEVEDDGLPSQVAPRSNRKPEPDDPSEPYSPNYGRSSYNKSDVVRPMPPQGGSLSSPASGPASAPPNGPAAQPSPKPSPPTMRGPTTASLPAIGWKLVASQQER